MTVKPLVTSLIVVGIAMAAAASQLVDGQEVLSLMLGFGLFSLNIAAMGLLAGSVAKAMRKQLTSGGKFLTFFLVMIKFALLVTGLYFGLIVYKLPGMYVGLGALVALLAVSWVYATQLLKAMAKAD